MRVFRSETYKKIHNGNGKIVYIILTWVRYNVLYGKYLVHVLDLKKYKYLRQQYNHYEVKNMYSVFFIRKKSFDPLCITASGNILANGNFCFRVFKRQLKVINKNVCYLYSVWINQINYSCTSISYTLFTSKFLAIY